MKHFTKTHITLIAVILLAIITSLGPSCFSSSGNNGGSVADSINYTIPANANYCMPKLYQEHSGISRISYYIQFEENCKYKLNTIDSNDINKAFGFSLGTYILAHQDNSTRLGWNWKTDTLLLYNYAYFNSVRVSKKIGAFARKQPIYIQEYYQGSDTIWISAVQNGKGKSAFVTGKGIAIKPGYYLYPYFGGTSKSPNTMNIKIWGVRATI